MKVTLRRLRRKVNCDPGLPADQLHPPRRREREDGCHARSLPHFACPQEVGSGSLWVSEKKHSPLVSDGRSPFFGRLPLRSPLTVPSFRTVSADFGGGPVPSFRTHIHLAIGRARRRAACRGLKQPPNRFGPTMRGLFGRRGWLFGWDSAPAGRVQAAAGALGVRQARSATEPNCPDYERICPRPQAETAQKENVPPCAQRRRAPECTVQRRLNAFLPNRADGFRRWRARVQLLPREPVTGAGQSERVRADWRRGASS